MARADFLDEDPRAPKAGPDRYVRRIKAGEKKMFLCYSETWWGVWTHWDGHRSTPHFKQKALCDGCKRGHPKRWKGYLDVANQTDKTREFLELTPGLCEQFEQELAAGECLRGVRFNIERGKGDKARMTLQLLAHIHATKPGAVIPPAADPKHVLLQLWGIVDLGEFGDNDADMRGENLAV